MSVSSDKTTGESGSIWEYVKILIQAGLIALVIRTVLFQPFNIPSGSMMDTLLVGDYLFVSKYSYGYSRYSFPFGLAPFDGRVLASTPEQGDIAVFKLPSDNRTDFIKRVIGLPGDEIQMRDGHLHINGEPVERERIEDFVTMTPGGRRLSIPRYVETLPNGVSYHVLDAQPRSMGDNTPVYTVPEGHYFVMGDNRDNSSDSRVQNYVGFVPFENFVGRAEIIFFSVEEGEPVWQIWKWPWSVRWGRIFDTL